MEDEKNEKKAMEKKEIVLITTGSSTVKAFLKVLSTSSKETCGAKFELNKNDDEWERLDCETGDEMECTYSIDQSNAVTVKEMKVPKFYSESVNVSNKESTVEVVPLSAYPNEKREK
ncbi:hypothetical protein RFI_37294, partial [Reticulomyxa filosa]